MILFIFSIVLSTVASTHAADNTCLLPIINLLFNNGNKSCFIDYIDDDPKYDLVYKGLYYYKPVMPHTQYVLEQLSDAEFNNLTLADRKKVADKLLAILFYGYPPEVLQQKITSGNFLCSVRQGLFTETIDMFGLRMK